MLTDRRREVPSPAYAGAEQQPAGLPAGGVEQRFLRVLVLSSVYPAAGRPTFGLFVRERVRHVAHRCAVQVMAPIAWFPFNRWIRGRERSAGPWREHQAGLTVYHPRFLCIPGIAKSLDPLLYFLCLVPWVLWVRRRFAFDLIDAHFAYPDGVAAVLLGALFRCPVLVTIRGDEARVAGHRLRRLQMRWALRRADRVIAVSASLREVAARIGVPAEHVCVIPNGVDIQRFAPADRTAARQRLGLRADSVILLAAGDFIERKGHHRVIELLPALLVKHPTLLYVAMGEDVPGEGCGDLLRRLVARHGLDAHVRLLGPRPHDEIPTWMAAADLFCLATRWEGWCNALMEALASGLPVVSTRVGGNAEFVREGQDGFLVPYWEPQAFAAAVDEALGRPWDRVAIAARVRTAGWASTAERVIAEFRQVLEKTERKGRS